MKNFTKLFALAVVILGFSATSFGQAVALSAKANVTSVAVLASTTDLNFGAIGTGAAGTVTIPTTGVRTGVGANLLPVDQGAAGVFNVKASDGTKVTVIKPSGLVTLSTTTGSGTKTMTISATNWHYKIGTATEDQPYTLSGETEVNVTVGATLDVVAAQAIGAYTGPYSFTIALE